MEFDAVRVWRRLLLAEGGSMRTVTYHCSRCGSTVSSDLSTLKIEAGSLVNDLAEPYIDISGPYVDLCPGCTSLFRDWLRSGRQHGQHEAGAIGASAGINSIGG
jgi:hypothetical protein